jgi:hypothetical protein
MLKSWCSDTSQFLCGDFSNSVHFAAMAFTGSNLATARWSRSDRASVRHHASDNNAREPTLSSAAT